MWVRTKARFLRKNRRQANEARETLLLMHVFSLSLSLSLAHKPIRSLYSLFFFFSFFTASLAPAFRMRHEIPWRSCAPSLLPGILSKAVLLLHQRMHASPLISFSEYQEIVMQESCGLFPH